MSEPTRMPAAKVRAAYDALGLDPERWKDAARFEITPEAVIVTWHLRNKAGRRYVGSDGEIASEVRQITIDWREGDDRG